MQAAPRPPIDEATKGKERPILFSGPMVRAIVYGRKTQSRRVVKPQPMTGKKECELEHGDIVFYGTELCRLELPRGRGKLAAGMLNARPLKCPYGVPGDQLWVRETWAEVDDEYGMPMVAYKTDGATIPVGRNDDGNDYLLHGANGGNWEVPDKWRPSIHMPRWASRRTLEVTGVRVERVQDISDADAEKEGVEHSCSPRNRFEELWDSINAKRGFGWKANPWVWVVEFKRLSS